MAKSKDGKTETMEISCKCGKAQEIYYKTLNGKYLLLPAELICTKCGAIIEMKDFVNA